MRRFALLVATLALAASIPVAGFAHQDSGQQKENSKQKDKNPLPPYTGPKKRLAIVDIEVKTAAPTDNGANNTGVYDPTTGLQTSPTANASATGDLGTGLTEMLATSLQDSNRFILLERKALADITAEQQLSSGAAFDQTSTSKAGQMLGAQFLIRGAVTEAGNTHTNQSGSGILNTIGVSSDHSESYIVLDIRIYEVATGVLLDSVKGEGKVKANSTGVSLNVGNLNLGTSGAQTSPLAQAARLAIADAVKKICMRLDKIPWEGHVADMDGTGDAVKYLYMGVGTAGGLKVGQHFVILHPGRTIVDPDTKVVIGRTKDTLIGHGVLETCTEKLATITVTDGTGFQVGDAVQWDDAPAAPATPAPAPAQGN